MKRNTLFSAMMAALLPVPVVAFDSGVNGMAEAAQYEQHHQTVASWAFEEFVRLETGFRQTLEPIYPTPKGFDIVDAQIADIVAQGELEKAFIDELLTALEARTEAVESEVVNVPTIEAQQSEVEPSVQNEAASVPMDTVVPDVQVMREDGTLLAIDTSEGIDLPNLTIDPRDGGTYESEIEAIDPALELLQAVQDQVPAPIQSAGNDLYNNITGTTKPDEQS